MIQIPSLAVVVPCYNEEDVLPYTEAKLEELLAELKKKEKISESSCVYYVDDGSSDGTWAIIEEFVREGKSVHAIKLSKNKGHQNALLAGLVTAEADIVVSIDADLQDDISVVEDMINAYIEGVDVVYGVRRKRMTDTYIKRTTAELYYKFLEMMGVDVVFNHADFRLLSRRAVEAIKQYSEVNLFLRGIVTNIGFRSHSVYYDREERRAGESKYPIRKMAALAIDGITSFTAYPLRLISVLGFLIFLVSVIISFWALGVGLFSSRAVPGWTSSVLPMYLLGGIQLFSIGVLGEYVGKIYIETKRRPRYFIEKKI